MCKGRIRDGEQEELFITRRPACSAKATLPIRRVLPRCWPKVASTGLRKSLCEVLRKKMGRPSMALACISFGLLLGYFEGMTANEGVRGEP